MAPHAENYRCAFSYSQTMDCTSLVPDRSIFDYNSGNFYYIPGTCIIILGYMTKYYKWILIYIKSNYI